MRKFTCYLSLAAMLMLTGFSAGCDGVQKEYKKKVLIRGADFHGTASLNFNPAGEMFVVDFFTGTILKTDPNTGRVLDSFSESVETADIDFGPDGTMYWGNPFSGQVYKRTTDGETTLIANVGAVIDGIAVNAEGRVFTASFARGQDALYEIDPNGVNPPRTVVALGGFDAFDFGPDGFLYAPDYLYGSGQIYKINVDTGEYTIVTSGFCQPIATKFNSKGELYVMDAACPKIVKVDLDSGEQTLVANIEAGCDNFDFNLQDELFIANNAGAYVGKLLEDGTVKNVTKPGLSAPGAIAIRADGTLFVADGFDIRQFDAASGEHQKTFYANAGMIPPFSLADDGKNLILTNSLFSYVQIWDPETNSPVTTRVDFKQPLNAIPFGDGIIVAEMGTGSVVKLGDHSALMTGLSVPAGLAANGDNLYVSDWATGKIWKAVEAGQTLASPILVAEGLESPEGIAYDNNGGLLVVEVGSKRLLRIKLATGDLTVLAKNLKVGLTALAGTPPIWSALSSVTVSESGDLYVTGDVGNVVYKFEKIKGR